MKPEPVDIMLSHQANCLFFDQALKELSTSSNLYIVTDREDFMHLLRDETTEIPDVLFPDMNMPGKSGTTSNSLCPITEELSTSKFKYILNA